MQTGKLAAASATPLPSEIAKCTLAVEMRWQIINITSLCG